MKQKDILLLLIPFSLIVVLYIILSIYHNIVTSTIPEVVNIQITPISPDFDQKTIIELKKRDRIVPVFDNTGGEISTSSAETQ